MNVEKLTEIADWILTLPKEEQFKISPMDFIKLANILEKYKNKQLPIDVVVKSFICQDCEKPSKEYRDNLCEPCHKWHTDS